MFTRKGKVLKQLKKSQIPFKSENVVILKFITILHNYDTVGTYTTVNENDYMTVNENDYVKM